MKANNMAAMHEALVKLRAEIGLFYDKGLISYNAWQGCDHMISHALFGPARNCDRFDDELDAQLEFLNEVWLISVDRDTMLERDKIDNWTREMCLRYAKWLMAPAPAEGDKHGV